MPSSPPDAAQLFSAKDLVVVITGAGSGLGREIALALDANGAKAVYILGRRESNLKDTAAAAKNGSIKTIVGDVTSKESIENAASIVRKEVGYVNVVLANSGIIGPNNSSLFQPKQASLEELQKGLWQHSMDDFSQVSHVNVTGAFYTAIAFLDLLDEANKRRNVPQTSQVIFTSSIAGFSRMPAAGFAYSASKAGVSHLTKQLATCLAPYKIRSNAIAPGFFPSEMTGNMPFMKGEDPRIEGNLAASLCPLERVGLESEISGLALFLMSQAGGYMDGCIHLIDGGRLSIMPAAY